MTNYILMISSSKQGFEEESISDMRQSLTSAPLGIAVAALWRCQEPQNFGRADSASTHWEMESLFEQNYTTLDLIFKLKPNSNNLQAN